MPLGQEWLAPLMQGLRRALHGASREDRLAVFLDGDNVSSRHANAIFEYARSLGQVSRSHVHANFSSGAMTSWGAAVRRHRIRAHQCFAETPGRNAIDIDLAVTAMDVLRDRNVDGFVIVTSDSDLSALVRQIIDAGLRVHGIGAEHTPQSFRDACSRFVTLKELHDNRAPVFAPRSSTGRSRFHAPILAEDLVLVTLLRMGAVRDWASVTDLAQALKERDPTFAPTKFRSRALSSLLDQLEAVELDRSTSPPRVRILPAVRNGSLFS